jgi:hypothetical protein
MVSPSARLRGGRGRCNGPTGTSAAATNLTHYALSTDLTATPSGSGKSRIEDSEIYPHGRWDPLTARRDIYHDEATIVAAELDPSPVPRECSYRGPRWRVGVLQTAVCCCRASVPLRKPQRNAQLTGALRVWRPKTARKIQTECRKDLADPRVIHARPADHSRDTTLQSTISSRFGLKITKLASRRSEHRNVVEMPRHFPQGRFGSMSEWPTIHPVSTVNATPSGRIYPQPSHF